MTNQPDNEARTILGEAIMACNALIIHLNHNPGTFPEATRQRMIEADYLLNSAASDVADFVGEFPAPVAVSPLDQLLFDLFVTAMEGGVQYWADVTAYHWSHSTDDLTLGTGIEDVKGFNGVIEDSESADPDDRFTVNRKVLAKGYRLATTEWRNKLAWSSEKPPLVPTEDGWDHDAGDADMIVQLGLFSDVRYG